MSELIFEKLTLHQSCIYLKPHEIDAILEISI